MKNGAIEIIEVSKSYKIRQGERLLSGEQFFEALKAVNLSISPGDRVGLIGENGSGKTTLMKLMANIAKPTKGRIEIGGKISCLLELGAGFHPDLTGRDNIALNGLFAGLSRKEVGDRAEEIIEFSGISEFIDMPFYTYSSGMKLRLAFAVAVHADPDILVFDEIVSMGDEKFIKLFMGYFSEIVKRGKTIIYASHVLEVLPVYCTKAVWVEKGKIKKVGEVNEVIRDYKREMRNAFESYPKDIKSWHQLSDFLRQNDKSMTKGGK